MWEDLCRELKKDQLEAIVVTMRSIWQRRNLFIFEAKFSIGSSKGVNCMHDLYMDSLEEFHQAHMVQEEKQHNRPGDRKNSSKLEETRERLLQSKF